MQQLPFIIRKHWFGQVVITFIGLALIALIVAGLYSMSRSGDLTSSLGWVGFFAVVLIAIVTVVELRVYSLSQIELSEDGLTAEIWSALFFKTKVQADWRRVQDVTVLSPSIWALMIDYGTLTVQTAGTAQQLKMSMVPNAEYWQAVIQSLADDALTQP